MKTKMILMIMLLTVIMSNANAQSNDSLIGKWATSYEEDGEIAHVTYEFKKSNGAFVCYMQYIQDDAGNGEAQSALVMRDIQLKKGKGKATYLLNYEGETYELMATLTLTNLNTTLEINYSYSGYSDTEEWKKVD